MKDEILFIIISLSLKSNSISYLDKEYLLALLNHRKSWECNFILFRRQNGMQWIFIINEERKQTPVRQITTVKIFDGYLKECQNNISPQKNEMK